MTAHFEAYLLQQASCQASLLVATAGFSRDDWQDLRQELAVDCLRRAPRFDPARGDWRGFVRGVVRNHAIVLITRRRRRTPEVLRGDLVVAEDVGARDSIDFPYERYSQGVDALHLSLDVRRVVESLPDKLRSLALLLCEMRVKEVCKHTGKSRSRVYQMTRQIRRAFVGAGLAPCSRLRAGRKSISRKLSVHEAADETTFSLSVPSSPLTARNGDTLGRDDPADAR